MACWILPISFSTALVSDPSRSSTICACKASTSSMRCPVQNILWPEVSKCLKFQAPKKTEKTAYMMRMYNPPCIKQVHEFSSNAKLHKPAWDHPWSLLCYPQPVAWNCSHELPTSHQALETTSPFNDTMDFHVFVQANWLEDVSPKLRYSMLCMSIM